MNVLSLSLVFTQLPHRNVRNMFRVERAKGSMYTYDVYIVRVMVTKHIKWECYVKITARQMRVTKMRQF